MYVCTYILSNNYGYFEYFKLAYKIFSSLNFIWTCISNIMLFFVKNIILQLELNQKQITIKSKQKYCAYDNNK